MSKILGIDLGTTNSAMAVLEGGSPTIIVNAEGDRTTPSVVGFRADGDRVVGKAAKNQAVTNPKNTVFSIKRFMGRKYSECTSEIKTVPYEVKEGQGGRAVVDIEGKDYTAEQVSAMTLAKMKADAEKYLGETVTDAVITVPGLLQRRPASGHQGRRHDRRPQRQAYRQRADRGCSGLWPGKAGHRPDASWSSTWAAAPSMCPSSRSARRRVLEVLVHHRATTTWAATTGISAIIDWMADEVPDRRTASTCVKDQDGPAASEGSRREGQEGAGSAAQQTTINHAVPGHDPCPALRCTWMTP